MGVPSLLITTVNYRIEPGSNPDIMRFLGREAEGVQLPDGNYFGTFTVFHHLLCLVNFSFK